MSRPVCLKQTPSSPTSNPVGLPSHPMVRRTTLSMHNYSIDTPTAEEEARGDIDTSTVEEELGNILSDEDSYLDEDLCLADLRAKLC